MIAHLRGSGSFRAKNFQSLVSLILSTREEKRSEEGNVVKTINEEGEEETGDENVNESWSSL